MKAQYSSETRTNASTHATDSSLVTTPVCDKVRAVVYLDSADTTIRHGSHTRRGIWSVPRGVSCPWQTGHVVKASNLRVRVPRTTSNRRREPTTPHALLPFLQGLQHSWDREARGRPSPRMHRTGATASRMHRPCCAMCRSFL